MSYCTCSSPAVWCSKTELSGQLCQSICLRFIDQTTSHLAFKSTSMRTPKSPSLHVRRKRGQDDVALREPVGFCPVVYPVEQCPKCDNQISFSSSEDKWSRGREMGREE